VEEALASVTTHPARLLRLEGTIGSLTTGSWADMVLLDDECHVLQTFLAGQLVYCAPAAGGKGGDASSAAAAAPPALTADSSSAAETDATPSAPHTPLRTPSGRLVGTE
jgi:adenine deaminase